MNSSQTFGVKKGVSSLRKMLSFALNGKLERCLVFSKIKGNDQNQGLKEQPGGADLQLNVHPETLNHQLVSVQLPDLTCPKGLF